MDARVTLLWIGTVLCICTLVAVLLNFRKWKMLYDHIRFWLTFRSWPTSDNRLKELQKDQFILEKLYSYAMALHKANERQARVLSTIKHGGLKYKEAIKQLAHTEREQKRRLGRFDRARAIAKHCGFDVSAYFHEYLPKVTKEQDSPRAIGGVSGG
ncbi:hypothetical protein MUP46_03565 [Patescibacteria group bacterium]|nr:hypothetical protein [Patescibacteria group bacterium]